MLALVARMRRCSAFVQVSSAYANAHLPNGAHVHERIYPLPGAGACVRTFSMYCGCKRSAGLGTHSKCAHLPNNMVACGSLFCQLLMQVHGCFPFQIPGACEDGADW